MRAEFMSDSRLVDRLAYFLIKKINTAVRDFRLIEEDDRIVVALSGGKDSCSLLDLLVRRQRRAREQYHLVAVHVIPPRGDCGARPDREALAEWVHGLGVECHFVAGEPATGQPARPAQSPCFHCAWRRRKALFLAADRLGCNKVAFAHHADDVARTTLLNLFYQGRLETMMPRVEFFGGRLTVIRPLVYVPEKELVRFAQASDFPPPPPPCPWGGARRALMGRILRLVEEDNPKVKRILWRAVMRCQGDLAQHGGDDGRE